MENLRPIDEEISELQRLIDSEMFMTPPPLCRQKAWNLGSPVCPESPHKPKREVGFNHPPFKIRALNFDYPEQVWS